MADWEKDHIAAAFSFELNQVENEDVRHHVLNELLVNVADQLAEAVSRQTGIAIAPVGTPDNPTPSAPTPSGPLRADAKDLSSPTLSLQKPCENIVGRKIALLGGDGMDAAQLKSAMALFDKQEAVVELIAAHAGFIKDSKDKPHKVNRAAPNAPSVVYDAVVVLGGASASALAKNGLAIHFVCEAFRHGKPLAFLGDADVVLKAARLPKPNADDGVIVDDDLAAFVEAMKQHRFPNRAVDGVPA